MLEKSPWGTAVLDSSFGCPRWRAGLPGTIQSGASAELLALNPVNLGVNPAQRGNTVLLNQLHEAARIRYQVFQEFFFYTKGEAHDIGLAFPRFQFDAALQVFR